MKWVERGVYLVLIIICYLIGRWQSENRATVQRALRAKEFATALNENRIEDIQFRLQDDVSVAAYDSYSPLSFGPDLWQKTLPKESITIRFTNTPSAHSKTKELASERTSQSPVSSTSYTEKPKTTFITEAAKTTESVVETATESTISTEKTVEKQVESSTSETKSEPLH